MRFTIHDVGHGFCAHLKHDNGNVMLWDCGHKADPEHRPSQFLPESGIRTVHRMFLTNYDEDHISDLPNLRRAVRINILHRNRSITPAQLKRLKEESGPISPAMESLLSMHESYTGDIIDPPSFSNVNLETAMERFRKEDGHVARHLVDTQYLSRLAKRYLSHVCDPVQGGEWRRTACVSRRSGRTG